MSSFHFCNCLSCKSVTWFFWPITTYTMRIMILITTLVYLNQTFTDDKFIIHDSSLHDIVHYKTIYIIIMITLVYRARGSMLQTGFSHDWSSITHVVSNKVQLSSNIIPASIIVDSIKHGVTDSREERATITIHWTRSKYHMPAETEGGVCVGGGGRWWGRKHNNGLVHPPTLNIVWFNYYPAHMRKG